MNRSTDRILTTHVGSLPRPQEVVDFIEHPELVAQRIVRYADLVGRDRVIAGTDCGFGTFAGFGAVHPSICWEKMRALAEGARIATAKLWGAAAVAV